MIKEVCQYCGGIRTLRGELPSSSDIGVVDVDTGLPVVRGFWEMPTTYCPKGHWWKRMKQ